MKTFLIDMPTLTSFWVTAANEQEAIAALYEATNDLELRLHIGRRGQPIELINTTCRHEEFGDYEIICEESDDDCDPDGDDLGEE